VRDSCVADTHTLVGKGKMAVSAVNRSCLVGLPANTHWFQADKLLLWIKLSNIWAPTNIGETAKKLGSQGFGV